MNINSTQLETSLTMQDNMNKTINPEWVGLGWDYMRASMLEAGEAVDHHGWKWWKKQDKDLAQLQMEIVDIWHFYLSRYLQLNNGNLAAAQAQVLNDWAEQDRQDVIFDGYAYQPDNMTILEKLDLLTGLSAAKRMNLHVFFSLCADTDLTWSELFKQYIKKNLLNIFRQKNGYKEGTYEKAWFDKEDNVYLVEEADKLDATQDTYVSDLWNKLEELYAKAVIYRQEKNA